MPLLLPKQMFRCITAITPQYLREHKIKALILDVDNTLTAHNSQELPADIAAWVDGMRQEGFIMDISSNNNDDRVRPFAGKIGLPYEALCRKPLPSGLIRARKKYGLKKKEMAMIGDQLFTDILGANLYGILSLMVLPMAKDIKPTIIFKRKLEKPLLRRYFRKGGTCIEPDSVRDSGTR